MELSDFLSEWNNDKDYVEGHTSGSTGAPKTIRLLKEDMRTSARATNSRFGIQRDSVLGIPLSMDYIAGKMMAVRALEADCGLVTLPVSNHLQIDAPLTLLSVVPSQVRSLIAQPELVNKITYIIIGGGPLDAKFEQQLLDMGYRAFASYGMTETCSHVALRSLGCEFYQAMPGIRFEVDDRDCLIIYAPGFSFGRLVTNDIVELKNEYKFRWRGRFDNVIISGGIKLHPEELEKQYHEFIDGDFYLIGIDDEKWGQALQMIMLYQGQKAEEIMEILGEHFDHRYLPKSIRLIKDLPKGKNGKIRRISI